MHKGNEHYHTISMVLFIILLALIAALLFSILIISLP